MERQEFLQILDELFELPAGTLKGPERLEDLERWDSLGVMSFIALANEHYGVTLSPRQLANCTSVNDLVALAETRQG